jgi:hypothetical protein
MARKATRRTKPAKAAGKARRPSTPKTDVEARRAAARERSRALKHDLNAYEAMHAAARERARAFHARRKAAAKTKAGSR